jgi:hypothetical protein
MSTEESELKCIRVVDKAINMAGKIGDYINSHTKGFFRFLLVGGLVVIVVFITFIKRAFGNKDD